MPADSVQAAGQRFARDMRRIREAREVTRDDIHEETRIARTLIETFEQDGLFDHPAFNRVYLRSFVRAYAGCIDVDPNVALDNLERAMSGEYDNDLAAEVLGATPGSEAWPPEPEVPDAGTTGAASEEEPEPGPVSPDAGTPSTRGPGDVDPDDLAQDQPPARPGADEPGVQDEGQSKPEDRKRDESGPKESEPVEPGEEGAGEEGEPRAGDDSGAGDEASDIVWPEEGADEPEDEPRSGRGPDADEEPSGDKSSDAASGPSWAQAMRDRDDDAPPRPQAGSSVGTPRPVDGGEPSPSTDPLEPTSREGAPDPRRTSRSSAGRDPSQGGGVPLASFFEERGREVIIGSVALVVAIVAIAGAVTFFGGDEPETAEPPPTAADTAATAADTTAPTREPEPPPANVTLGETLHLTVRANEDVSGIRIRRDTDLRRPYWIEGGRASVFPFSDRVIIEEELDKVDLYLERYPYPVTATDARGRIVINRDSARAFVDTLRGDPPALDASTDTIPIPPPAPPEPASDPNGEPDAEPNDATGR